MGILNYTTTISVEKTTAEIQKKLVVAGARSFLSDYDDNGIMCAISFKFNNVYFRLPINIDGVYNAMVDDRNIQRRFKTYEQASRVAWRIIKDWVEAQVAIIQAGQAEMTQVFLPYAQTNDGVTLYDTLKGDGFKLITQQ